MTTTQPWKHESEIPHEISGEAYQMVHREFPHIKHSRVIRFLATIMEFQEATLNHEILEKQ